MTEYIELTDLWSAPFDYIIDTCGSSVAQGFVDRVNEIKPADVRPVVRGEWINTDAFDKESNVKCSECEMEFDYIDGICYLCAGHRLPNFCPNCGADMRGTQDE